MQNVDVHSFVSKNPKNKILVLEGNNATLDTILSMIDKSNHATGYVKSSNKRRRTDLTCVICESQCSGSNFNVISCGSCKSFFQRNLSLNLNDLRCLSTTNQCDMRVNNPRRMCRRCRLVKCLSVGMRRNGGNQATTITGEDSNRLNSIQLSYEKGFELTTMKHDASEFNQVFDHRSALLHSAANSYCIALGLIQFIRNIPEFQLLDEQDRFTLVKYNSPLVFFMPVCLNYDTSRDLVIDPNVENEEYALLVHQWGRRCYGEQLVAQTHQLFRSIKQIIRDDPLVLQITMIIFFFSRPLLFEDLLVNEHSFLRNSEQVFDAQSIYTSLLFRYLISKHSTYDEAVLQYSRLILKIIQLSMIVGNYQQVLQNKLINANDEELNPVMKSILRLD